MEIKITIEGLDQLAEAIALVGSGLAVQKDVGQAVKEFSAVQEKGTWTPGGGDVDDSLPAPAPVADSLNGKVPTKQGVKEEVKNAKQTTITREQVREAMVLKNTADNRPKIKAILTKYKAPNISTLAEEHFEAVMAEIEAL